MTENENKQEENTKTSIIDENNSLVDLAKTDVQKQHHNQLFLQMLICDSVHFLIFAHL